jgi:small nuclear ribonucleoprotein E
MNVVMDDATEVYTKADQASVPLGRILLKGENITLIQPLTS